MKYSLHTILFTALLLSFASCKKEKQPRPGPDPVPEQFLAVKLNGGYLTPAQVDSAFAIWTSNGLTQRVKMDLSNDSLITELEHFNEGTGTLTIHVFANKKYYNQYTSQFIFRKTITLRLNQGLAYNGPASFFDEAWLPRVLIKDGIGHEAVVGLRPDDAYFIIKDPGHAVYQYSVDKSYWKTIGGVQMIGRDIWRCTTECTGVENEEYFKSLPGRINNRPWNHISIYVLFETNDSGEGWVIGLEHDI